MLRTEPFGGHHFMVKRSYSMNKSFWPLLLFWSLKFWVSALKNFFYLQFWQNLFLRKSQNTFVQHCASHILKQTCLYSLSNVYLNTEIIDKCKKFHFDSKFLSSMKFCFHLTVSLRRNQTDLHCSCKLQVAALLPRNICQCLRLQISCPQGGLHSLMPSTAAAATAAP